MQMTEVLAEASEEKRGVAGESTWRGLLPENLVEEEIDERNTRCVSQKIKPDHIATLAY